MISILFSAFLLAGDVAATTPAPVPATEAPKEERKICKRQAVSTSLYGSKRICMTANEWKARERQATLEDMGAVTTK